MSRLSHLVRVQLERLLAMGSGYVLNFSDRTLRDFVLEHTGKDIGDGEYSKNGTSKANRLRAFWQIESDQLVSKLIEALLNYWELEWVVVRKEPASPDELAALAKCRAGATALRQSAIDAGQLAALGEDNEIGDNALLSVAVRESIERGHPEAGLDRLHTLVTRRTRKLCDKHNLVRSPDDPLHSCFGQYVKHLRSIGKLQSRMADLIMRSAISLLDAYNDVRNNRSLAHDNPLLDRAEAMLICNSVFALLAFVDAVESAVDKPVSH